jgi:Ca2+-binding RTX toxin-like protein
MEYVEGGSLAQQLAGTPQPARQAAALVAAVAEAVHTAHQRGVVHRDLNASDQNDAIMVNSTWAATPVEINAGAGDDSISTGNMDLLAGKLTVHGEGGKDTLTINDTAARTNRNYVITSDTVKQGAHAVSMDTLEGVTIAAPDKVNTFLVQDMTGYLPLTLKGGSARDTVTISDADLSDNATYFLEAGKVLRGIYTGAGYYMTGATVNYTGIEKLAVIAGNGDDTFKMYPFATPGPALTLDGGAGTNMIDYVAYTSNVIVNLAAGNATGVKALSNVENARGGAGDDILVGDAKDNVLWGGAGRDVIIGGKGADQLYGGAGEDLMIAGDTAFDVNAAALATIRTTWSGKGTTQERINKLKLGVAMAGGAVQLNDITVHVTGAADDGARDQFFSDDAGAAHTPDWFWANPGSDSTQDDLTLLSGDFFK